MRNIFSQLINGSETVDPHTVDRFCKVFHLPHNPFAPGYGLSECVCVATLSSQDYRSIAILLDAYRQGRFQPDANGEKTIVSLGRPASDMQVVAVRKDGSLCQEGEIGEICLRGSNVCSGYWKNPEQSRAFETVIPGLEGYFYRTGDTNVTGTAEALRFACDGRPKYFHYISSYSVYDNPSHFVREVLEDDPMERPEGYFLGYTED